MLYSKLGRLRHARFISILENNVIRNCSINAGDARRVVRIWGYDTFDTKGKMTHQKNNEVSSFVPISLPEYVTKHHKDLTFSADFFYV